MFCASCGAALEPEARFCEECGAAANHSAGPTMQPLHRRLTLAVLVSLALAAGLATLVGVVMPNSRPFTEPSARIAAPVTKGIASVIFDNRKFSGPIILTLCKDVDRAQVARYKQRLSAYSGGFPPLLLFDERCGNAKITRFLASLGYVEYDPVVNSMRGDQMLAFYYTDKFRRLWTEELTVKVADRRLKAITYTNSYRVNPLGLGERTAFAMTFTYTLEKSLPGLPDVRKTFTGKSLSILDPADGLWKLEEMNLEDNGDREYLSIIEAR